MAVAEEIGETGRAPRFLAFVLLALVLHLAAFALWPRAQLGGPNGAGEGGFDVISLAPGDGSLSALVAEWERPPALDETPAALPEPPAPQAAPVPDLPPDVTVPAAPDAPPAPAEMALPAPVPDAPPAPVAAPAPPKAKAQPAKPKPAKPQRSAPPKAAPAAPGPAQAGAKAAGAGGGTAAGVNGTSREGSLSPGALRSALAEWGGQIRARIERQKQRPAGGASGRVLLALTVGRDGRLISVSVAQSAGAAADAAALASVRAAGRFPPAPASLAEPSYSFTLPLRFAR